MTIPTISIDGVSMPVSRGGENLLSDMSLDAVARQVLDQGAAFEVAVEQFQRAMAELPVPANDTPAPLASPIEQKIDPPVAVATSFAPPVWGAAVPAAHEGAPAAPEGTSAVHEGTPTPLAPSDWDNGHLARCGNAGIVNGGAPETVVAPAPLPSAPLLQAVAQERNLPDALLPVGENIEAVETAPLAVPPAGTDPLPVPEAAGRSFPQVGTDPLPVPPAGTDPLPVSEEERLDSEPPVLQAAPVAVAVQPQVIDVKNVAVEPVQVVAARVAHQVAATPAQVLIEAASAVADTIVVSPGLLRGSGEVQVQLRPDVLEGTVIRISTTAPGSLTVQFTPLNENMAALLEKCAPQLVTYLSERIHSVQVAVNVKRDEKLKG